VKSGIWVLIAYYGFKLLFRELKHHDFGQYQVES